MVTDGPSCDGVSGGCELFNAQHLVEPAGACVQTLAWVL